MNYLKSLAILGMVFCLSTLFAVGQNWPIVSSVSQDDTRFSGTNKVTKTPSRLGARPVRWILNSPVEATNTVTVTASRSKVLVNREVSPPEVTSWTNTLVIATIATTNSASGAIDTGTITSNFRTKPDDSITYSNSVLTNAVLTIDWSYE